MPQNLLHARTPAFAPDPTHRTDDVIRQSLTIIGRNVFENIDRNWMLAISDIEIADLVAPLRWNKCAAGESKLQDAERQAVVVRKDFDIRRIELASRVEIADHDLGKRMFTGNETIGSADIVGQGPELEAEIRLIEHEIQFAQQKYITTLNRRSLESVRAPFDGTILQLPQTNNATVRRGDVIAVIEQRKNRQVTAFLNQDEVLRIGLDDEVSVFVPSVGKTIKGFVKEIDRTSGFIREQDQRTNPGATWRGPTDRSAKVTIAFFDPREVEDFEKYRTGVPVVAVFERRATNSVLSKLGNAFGL